MRSREQSLALALLVACLYAAGCQRTAEQPDSRAPTDTTLAGPTQPINQDSLRDAWVQNGVRVQARTRAQFVAELGQPDSAHAEAVPNRHMPGQTDTVSTLYFPGLRVGLHKAGEREFVTELLITDNRYLAAPVRIGMSWQEVLALLGPPLTTHNGQPGYDCKSCLGAENPVYFNVQDGRVTSVHFTYYVD